MRIKQIRSGNALRVVIINGFLSETVADVSDWLEIVNRSFPEATVLHCDWDASNIAKFRGLAQPNPKHDGWLRSLAKVTTNVVSQKTYLPKSVLAESAKQWRSAMNNAAIAGNDLTNYIETNTGKYILMGHSLGARVIFNCLNSLKYKDYVLGAFLFGGAVGVNETWGNIANNNPKLRIFNCYSQNDLVLKSLYRVGTLFSNTPVGLSPIVLSNKNRVHNIDMSVAVNGHTDYKKAAVGNLVHTYINTPR
ncbi:DUF726 domain-containing protein [uncultured Shewanella sp.]|uniref:DUF726 domain-containing protein n=1 Tax=uncultured Shewanella sp. TaxID=173975 RepID=UPI002624ECB1|nr:DUF726 domain-containing protein [uncultured Shewanella sp.]